MHRPARRCQRQRDGPGDHRRGALGLDLEARLHQGAQQRCMVEDLMGVAAADAVLDHAGDHQERRPLLRGVGDAIDRVGKAGTQGRHQETRRAGNGGGAGGHDGCRRLVPGKDEVDAGLGQRIDQGDDLAAGHAEGVAHARGSEATRHTIRNPHHPRSLACQPVMSQVPPMTAQRRELRPGVGAS